MQNIIYKSDNIIPWDTQSAFKMMNYYTRLEEHMVFCYLKSYVHKNDLVLCSYCFEEQPKGCDKLHLYINPQPEVSADYIKVDFGFDGVSSAMFGAYDLTGDIAYSSFKADDEQGFYWCGEIIIPAHVLKEHRNVVLREKGIITMNMVQSFENGDTSVLFANRQTENRSSARDDMSIFVVLNY